MTTVERLETEEKWLKKRREVITATEAPILLGLNKWESPNKLTQRKFHGTFKGNAYTIIGNILETAVISATNYALGRNFKIIEEDGIKEFYKRSDVAIAATPDAREDKEFLECKTTKPFNYLKYAHCPPEYYVAQLQAQLYCADLDVGYLAIMSTDLTQKNEELALPLAIFRVQSSKRLQEIFKSELERFWDCYNNDKMFRVSSKIKIKSRLLVNLSYEKVY